MGKRGNCGESPISLYGARFRHVSGHSWLKYVENVSNFHHAPPNLWYKSRALNWRRPVGGGR